MTGLPTTFVADLRSYLRLAKKYSILVIVVLWDFLIADSHSQLYTSEATLTSYINSALVPMVTALASEPALAAWEIS